MTLRAKPVARRRGRAGWEPGDRRNNLINIGFFVAIGLSVLILVGYAAWSWYDDHFGAAATVNGVVITKDELRNRARIETFRLDYIESRITTLRNKGRITEADAESQLQFLQQRRQQLSSLALERLVDVELMATLATEHGVTVEEADVEAQLIKEATIQEQRHTWMIEVEPDVDPDTGEIEDEQREAAQDKAEAALRRLRSGESWEDVAREVSTSGLAPQAGDLGWLSEESGYDEPFMAAVWAAEINEPTGVIEGEDDIYRIGRYTESAAEEVDGTYQAQVQADDITLADYRVAVRGDVVREKLSEKIVADLSQPGTQRHALEIYLPEPNASSVGTEPGVKVRHILFSPNDDPDKAGELPDDDPAWAAAKAEADAAYADLRADIDEFDEMAREESDESSAARTGGKQPWYYPSSSIDTAFKNAILAQGLTPGQLLEPVKTEFGWHVIQFLRPLGDGEAEWLQSVRDEITDEASFEQAAKDNSEGEEAGDGGDIGWIAMGQLEDQLDAAIFGTAVGSMSQVIASASGGTYLYRVLAEETREPTEEQLAIFEESGFSYWYTKQKEDADIDYPLASTTGTG